ncbi:MAG: type VI secretion protein [Sphingomonas sp.]|nr:MAG: type VI secretion protein [Sphingomonas sp.]
MIAIMALLLVSAGGVAPEPAGGLVATANVVTQRNLLKDWALSRCLARGAPQPFAKDAAVSAAAILERGDYGMEAYEAVEALVGKQLGKRYAGSVPGNYVTLKCIDLYHGAPLDAVVRRQKTTPSPQR